MEGVPGSPGIPRMDLTLAVQGLVNLFTNMDGNSRVMFIKLLVTQMKDEEVDVFLQVIQFRQKAESGESTSPDVSKFLNIELKQEPIEYDADSYFQSSNYRKIEEDEHMREQEESGEIVCKTEKQNKIKSGLKIKLGLKDLTKEKPWYYCDKCDKKCQKRSDLINHVETVHEGLSFDCLECDHKATRKWNLKAHVDLVHRGIFKEKYVYEKKFFCDKCSMKFSKMSDLSRHLDVHAGVRYPCQECDYTATKKWHLQQHVDSTHKGIIYPCGQCSYEAKTKQTLQRHMRSIHDGVRYPCEFCGYQATQKHCLKKHIQIMHSGPAYAFAAQSSTGEENGEASRSEIEDGHSREDGQLVHAREDERGHLGHSSEDDRGQLGHPKEEARGQLGYSKEEAKSQLEYPKEEARSQLGYPKEEARGQLGYPKEEARGQPGYPKEEARGQIAYPKEEARGQLGYLKEEDRGQLGHSREDDKGQMGHPFWPHHFRP